jgi:hypothetical protein
MTSNHQNHHGQVALAVKSTMQAKPLVAWFAETLSVAEALKQLSQSAGCDAAELRDRDRLRHEISSCHELMILSRDGKLLHCPDPQRQTVGSIAEAREIACESGSTTAKVAAVFAQKYAPVG